MSGQQLSDFASMAGIEYLQIDEHTRIEEFRKEIRWNDVYYQLSRV